MYNLSSTTRFGLISLAFIIGGVRPAFCGTPEFGFVQHVVTTPGPYFGGITLGPDGAMWFVEELGNNVGRVSRPGEVSEFPIPTPNSSPIDICSGSDGALWFVETVGKIGRITTSGDITEFPAPGAFGGITAGPDGALWFTEFGSGNIGRISLDGTVTTFPTGINPISITTGSDHALWFVGSQVAGFYVGRITTDGLVTLYPIPTYDNGTSNITSGPDGALWFTETNVSAIGRITTSGMITEFDLPPSIGPEGITAGPDGALWFVEFYQPQVGRITTDGTLTEFSGAPDALATLAFGLESGLWLVSPYTQSVVQMIPTQATLQPVPNIGSPGMAVLLEGNGFDAGEAVDICRDQATFPCSPERNVATVNAGSDGSILAASRAFFESAGTESFVARGSVSGNTAVASFEIQPELILSKREVVPGATIVVEGFGYESGDTVLIAFDDVGQEYAYANDAGTFSKQAGNAVSFTVPDGVTPGVHLISGSGYYSGTYASAQLFVQ